MSAPPRFLVTADVRSRPPGMVGVVVKMLSQNRVPFTLVLAPEPGDRIAMARLLSLAMVDHAFPVIHPTLMPSRPGFAVLRDDGSFRHQVTRTFSPWITTEVSRLAKLVLPDAAQILAEVYAGPDRILKLPSSETPFREGQPGLFEFDIPAIRVDLSGFKRDWEGLKRHELVRKEYEKDRYMAHLDRVELDARAKMLFRGFYQIDRLGRITVENDARTHFWMDRMTEVMHEYLLRGISHSEYRASMAMEESLRRGKGAVFRAAGRTTGAYEPPDRPYVVKYGQLDHMIASLESGRLRLGPAASFDDASLNPAQRDPELTRSVDWDSSILPFAADGQAPSYRGAPVGSRMRITATAGTDFYVYCLAGALRTRLFNDFETTAALVIYEPDEFLRRLHHVVRSELAGWEVAGGPVEYYDPLNVSPSEVRIPFWKDFGYAYQEELRIVIYPPEPVQDLQVRFIEIGLLEDIADVVVIDP